MNAREGRTFLAPSLVLLGCLWAAVASASAPPFQPRDVFDLQWVADPQISPDGRSIAYLRMGYDVKTDRLSSAIWLIGSDGKQSRPLSAAARSSSPRWSPDGTRIAYLSAAPDGTTQLFVYWLQSAVAAPISNFTESPSALAWSRDGRSLAFTMPVAADHKPLKVQLPEAPKSAKWAEPPKIIDRLVFRVDGSGYVENAYTQLFVIAADGGAARQLTRGDFDVFGTPAFSADGASVVFAANRRADAAYEPLDTEIYRIRLSDGELRALTDRRGPDHDPVVSPDGKQIAYLGFDDQRLGYQATQLYVMDIDGTHPRSLTATLDRDVQSPLWAGNGREILFQYPDHGGIKIGAVDLSGRLRTLAADVGGADVTRPYIGGSFTAASSGRFAYTRNSARSVAALGTGTTSRDLATLAAPGEALLGARHLGALEALTVNSSVDGRPIEGWIVKPAEFDPAKKYPLLLEIHGGPFASYGPGFAAEIELYAAAGYVVLYTNPRGSTGYGEQFANLIHHDYPNNDFGDLMSAVDAVLARGYIDPARQFVTGGSGGGVLTAWIVGHTDRFRAAVVVKPVINWTSFVLTADMTNYFYRYWFEGFPWENSEAYWKRSPLAYVGNVKTPTMLMTGEVDYRTPSSEAEQFYAALKLRKVDTALVRVPNASHDISARPSLLIDKVAYVTAWLQAHDVNAP